jgi:hypothetical protein
MPDVLDRLRAADPCATPADPAAPEARALLLRSLHADPATPGAASTGVAPATPHHLRRPAEPGRRGRPSRAVVARVAAGTVAAAAVVVAIATAGGGATDARAAVVRAVRAMTPATSGVIVHDHRTTSDADGELLAAVHQVTRWSGTDVEISGTGSTRVESSGQLVTEPLSGSRVVDGKLYFKRDSQPWRPATGTPYISLAELTRDAQEAPSRFMTGAALDATEALAAALTNVTQSADGRSFDGQVTPAALQAAYADADGFTVESVTAHASNDLVPIAVHLEVGDDGALDKVTFTRHFPYTHPTLAAATDVQTIDYSGVGEAQAITAPSVG